MRTMLILPRQLLLQTMESFGLEVGVGVALVGGRVPLVLLEHGTLGGACFRALGVVARCIIQLHATTQKIQTCRN